MSELYRDKSGSGPRPPYVRFVRRAVRDHAASNEAGYEVPRDEDFALITPVGSKDCVDKIAVDWLKEIDAKSRNGDSGWPRQFVDHFKFAYEEFKNQNEVPPIGTAIRGWLLLQPSEQQRVISANVLTVEDLAEAHEGALARIGMGSRALKEKAATWLATRNDGTAKVTTENINLRVENERLTEENASLQEKIRELESALKMKK